MIYKKHIHTRLSNFLKMNAQNSFHISEINPLIPYQVIPEVNQLTQTIEELRNEFNLLFDEYYGK